MEEENKAVGLIAKLFERSEPVNGLVPLEPQLYLAALALVLASGFGFLGFRTKSLGPSLVFIALLSVALAFAAVFLVDGVRVYTG